MIRIRNTEQRGALLAIFTLIFMAIFFGYSVQASSAQLDLSKIDSTFSHKAEHGNPYNMWGGDL